MKKTEVWAVEQSRIAEFFQSLPDSAQKETDFVFGDCRVTVTALEPRRMAGLALPQTRVVFEGEEAAVSAVYRLFLPRFLSAGG